MKIDLATLRALRLEAHGLRSHGARDPAVIASRLLALQGQDLGAVRRALAVRARVDLGDVDRAFDDGRLVRSWTMRGTLFAVTPRNLAALLALNGPRMLTTTARYAERAGLDAAARERLRQVAVARLRAGPLSRAELLEAWTSAGEDVGEQRGYHAIGRFGMEGVLHWGPFRGTTQLLALSEKSISLHPQDVDPQALWGRVVRDYLTGHGPATVEDLVWWLKQPKTVVQRVLKEGTPGLAQLELDGQQYWCTQAQAESKPKRPGPLEVHLVPAFDEYFLGYAKRDVVASERAQAAVVPGGNGMFRPLILSAGEVVGMWRRAPGAARAPKGPVQIELVEPVSARVRRRIEEVAEALPA